MRTLTICNTVLMAAGINVGSAAAIPSARETTILNAVSRMEGKAVSMNSTSLNTTFGSSFATFGSAFIKPDTREVITSTAKSRTFGSPSAILSTRDSSISPTLVPNSSKEVVPAATPCASETNCSSSGRMNSPKTRPNLFLSESPTRESLSNASCTLERDSRSSPLITAPIVCASCVNSAIFSDPAAINGLRSCADLPKIFIAMASRSVPSSYSPSLSINSPKTSSAFLKLPSASVTDTPNSLKASAAAPDPFIAENILEVSFFMLPVMVSTEVSVRFAMYW